MSESDVGASSTSRQIEKSLHNIRSQHYKQDPMQQQHSPSVAEDVQTNAAVNRADVRMPDVGDEADLRRLERIAVLDGDGHHVGSAGVWRVRRTRYFTLHPRDVVADESQLVAVRERRLRVEELVVDSLVHHARHFVAGVGFGEFGGGYEVKNREIVNRETCGWIFVDCEKLGVDVQIKR